MSSILDKIKEANLVGRGGAGFPVSQKWNAVKEALGEKKYVICNVSEGEPGVKKDEYLLDKYPEKVIDGMKLAIDFLGTSTSEGIIYINETYNKKFAKKLTELIADAPIKIFTKPHDADYIGGEESALLNTIEGKRTEPRLKPPFPVTSGLWGAPTLINNVETFYNVSLVGSDEYENMRFYTISEDCINAGVYELPENFTVGQILKETGNYPEFPFFAQVGGNGSGEVLNSEQLEKPASGAASIAVYKKDKYEPKDLILKWVDFFYNESCGQCTICREGTYRLKEILESKQPNWQLFKDLMINLNDTSFCALGSIAPMPVKSYILNVLSLDEKVDEEIKSIIELFKT